MKKPGLYWRTIRHLTGRQRLFQVWHRLRGRGQLRVTGRDAPGYWLAFSVEIPAIPDRYHADKQTFTLLNLPVSFPERIDWNYAPNGKLWTYHLTYFNYLNGLPVQTGLRLIHDFISQTDTLRDGLEAYPTSLRIGNWIWFLSQYQINDPLINAHLFAQTARLRRRLEYHLGGNHLLENSFALLLASLYFRHHRWFRQAASLLRAELNRQFLPDGAHAERSPSYHHALLQRLTDLTVALRADGWHTDPTLLPFLEAKAELMHNWLSAITFQNGDWPVVNDCTPGAVRLPTNRPLNREALQTNFPNPSGHYLFRQPCYELFVDAAAVGPHEQPGHAHADTFSFVLYAHGRPLIVDVGTSTYEPGQRRQWERSTAAHNTVEVAGQNSSEVWASFRVGRRAQVTILEKTHTTLTARHDGYRHLGVTHKRSWKLETDGITIDDQLLIRYGLAPHPATARFYFHPDQAVSLTNGLVLAGPAQLRFTSPTATTVQLTDYELADGFNQLRPARCAKISFMGQLTTHILLYDDIVPDVLF